MLLSSYESSGVYAFRPAATTTYIGNVYRFAISVEHTIPGNNFTVSSGLVWSNCVYNVNKSKSVLCYQPVHVIATQMMPSIKKIFGGEAGCKQLVKMFSAVKWH